EREKQEDREKKTENEFLLEFDIQYHLRRLGFLNRRINQLVDLDEDSERFLKAVRDHSKEWKDKHASVSVEDLIKHHGINFQNELNLIKKLKIAPALREARLLEENLRKRGADSGKKLYDAIATLRIGWPDLKAILDCDPGAAREGKARDILKDKGRSGALSELAKIIREG